MNRIKRTAITLGATTLLTGVCANLLADARVNPFGPIAERNPFGLKPPPPVDPDAGKPPPPPPAPLATVALTGITSILSSKRALLEIIPGPGKPMIKPILSEGERLESIEVVSINVEKNEVTIKNGGTVTNLTFNVAKSNTTPPPPPAGGLPGLAPKLPLPSPVPQPTQTSYNNNQGSGRYGVTLAGGASPAAPAAAATGASYGGAQNTGATPAYGGVNPGGVNPSAPTLGGGTDGGFRSIPSRNIRSAAQPEADPAISRLQAFEAIENNRAMNHLQSQLTGRPLPPLPGTPITPPDAPGFKPPGQP